MPWMAVAILAESITAYQHVREATIFGLDTRRPEAGSAS